MLNQERERRDLIGSIHFEFLKKSEKYNIFKKKKRFYFKKKRVNRLTFFFFITIHFLILYQQSKKLDLNMEDISKEHPTFCEL